MGDQTPVRVRYAPSPTGYFHVGGARTALYDYLLARQTGGQFILRIEDTDQSRFNPQAIDDLLDGLRFLGLQWDEGPDIGGPHAPYAQTQRLHLYQQYAQQLLKEGKAYRCFATPEELAEANEARRKAGLSPGYDRRYRDYDPTEAEHRAVAGESHVLRIKIPLEGSITVTDALRGDITVENHTLQDAVLVKSDGIPTYAFAAMIDDHLMGITHVLRGEEWLSSFPLHMHVIQALGWTPPTFVHLPVILNPAGKGKMSKREDRAPDGTVYPVFVHTFKEMGYLPEAMVNFLALMGWSYDDKTEMMSRDELVARFSLDRVNTSPASWNYDKLNHFNSTYIRALSVDAFVERVTPFLEDAGLQVDPVALTRIAPDIQERLTTLREASDWVDFLFASDLPPYEPEWLVPRKTTAAEVIPILQAAKAALAETGFQQELLEAAIKALVKELGIKTGQMFQPLRVAISGKRHGPPLFTSIELLGQEVVQQRLTKAIVKLEEIA